MNLTSENLKGFKSFQTGKTLQGSIERGGDLLNELENIVKEAEIKAGYVQVLGAVKKAKVGYFNQDVMEYEYHTFDCPMEILHCMGNISLLANEPMIHAHILLGDEDGNSFGGHLEEGTEVFVGETIIQEFIGEPFQREEDPESGLSLWAGK